MAFQLFPEIFGVPKRYSDKNFDNFKITDENKKVYEICKNWDGSNSITLTGKTGTGKTHLAIAMLKNFPKVEIDEIKFKNGLTNFETVKERCEKEFERTNDEYLKLYIENEAWRYRRAKCLFAPLVEVFTEINTAAMGGNKKDILEKYSKNFYDCICFDDLGVEKMTDAKSENLYYIIDSRYRSMLPTILTSNLTMQEISLSDMRIASRLAEMGLMLQFNGKDYRKK